MKVLLISHIADLDGIMPVILTDLVFDNYDYKLLDTGKPVDEYMLESLKNRTFDKYDKIIMTDLCVSEEIAQIIDKIELKNKFYVLDHHFSNVYLNKYSFITVVDELENGYKESGTSLYYRYLLENYPNDLLKRNSVSRMTELVRLRDTWQWEEINEIDSCNVNTLLSYYGNDGFIKFYSSFLRENDEFYFTSEQKILIEADNTKRNAYLESLKDKVIFRKIKNYKVGIIFTELYRSEVGHYLAKLYYDEVDLIMVVNLNRSLSFRAEKNEIDVSEVAKLFGGKGHKLASGAPLPVTLKEDIVDLIFKGIE